MRINRAYRWWWYTRADAERVRRKADVAMAWIYERLKRASRRFEGKQ